MQSESIQIVCECSSVNQIATGSRLPRFMKFFLYLHECSNLDIKIATMQWHFAINFYSAHNDSGELPAILFQLFQLLFIIFRMQNYAFITTIIYIQWLIYHVTEKSLSASMRLLKMVSVYNYGCYSYFIVSRWTSHSISYEHVICITRLLNCWYTLLCHWCIYRYIHLYLLYTKCIHISKLQMSCVTES